MLLSASSSSMLDFSSFYWSFVNLYHWLCCGFFCWCLLVHLWSSQNCHCLCWVHILIILTYRHLLCLMYLWCRFSLLCRIFQCFHLQFLHCSYLASLPRIHIPEFDCCQLWGFIHQLSHAPETIPKWGVCSLLLAGLHWYITPLPFWLIFDQSVTHPKCSHLSYCQYIKILSRILQYHSMPLTKFLVRSLFS